MVERRWVCFVGFEVMELNKIFVAERLVYAGLEEEYFTAGCDEMVDIL